MERASARNAEAVAGLEALAAMSPDDFRGAMDEMLVAAMRHHHGINILRRDDGTLWVAGDDDAV